VLTYAYVWARDETGETNALPDLFAACEVVDSYYEDCFSTLDSPLGLNELGRDYQLSLSPNPAADEVRIRINTAEADIESLRVFDLTGAQVKVETRFEDEAIRINIQGLTRGYYLVQLTDRDGRQLSSPLIKN